MELDRGCSFVDLRERSSTTALAHLTYREDARTSLSREVGGFYETP